MRQPVVLTLFLLGLVVGLPGSPVSAALDAPAWQATGGAAGDAFGFAVAAVPDVDGDGLGDVVVGARLDDVGSMADAGSVSVLSGATGTLLWTATGDTAGDWFGHSVAGVPDLDGDGLGDVIVGSLKDDPSSRTDAGSVSVYSGATGTFLWKAVGDTALDAFGASVSGVPDADGDGYGDVLVGAPEDDPRGIASAGSATLYSGATGTFLWRTGGSAVNDHLGTSVAGVEDLDGDGFGDFVAGAPEDDVSARTNCGSVSAWSGATGTLLWQMAGDTAGDRFGCAVAGVSDLDLDGLGDVVVGANFDDPGARADAGSAYALSGVDGSVVWQAAGTTTRDNLGWAVAGVPDADGDGVPDVLVGTPFRDAGGLLDSGEARLYSGADGSLLFEVGGAAAGDAFGQSVAGLADVDGDGLGDLAVGASGDDAAAGVDAGSVTVYGTYDAPSDTTAPTITCPADTTVEATGSGGATVTFSVTATDDVDPSPTVSCVPASGSLFPLGTSTVLCTATDASGNSSTCSFTVLVEDTTGPSVTCPSDVVVEAEGPGGTAVAWEVEVSDVVDGDPGVTATHDSGATYPIGTTTVTVTSTDASGNESSCSFDVTVEDTTAPVVDASVALDLLSPPTLGTHDVGLSVSVTDAADTDPVVRVAVYSDEAGGTGAHAVDATLVAGVLSLRAERAGSGDGRVYLVVVSATDDAGNVGMDCTTVVVPRAPPAAQVAAVREEAATADATARANGGTPPSGWFTLLAP